LNSRLTAPPPLPLPAARGAPASTPGLATAASELAAAAEPPN
jgi:hypothetical protein